ncbi:type I-E CRISPR-associated protein Cse1/CasA [Bifidobacterium simiarum]|nr:type I-E CRISPR-associated protein Cse1/CasA [Bifidobacterium simiarum]MBT1165790.1 type I-E CRISPR-associated protein Cse1/CasA [Bifidobacterium simiarum]
MDRAWIPVTMLDGSYAEMSIIGVLAHADEIRSIEGDISLQRFALSRLLIAVLYGTYGNDFPIEIWRDLWEYGPKDPEIAQMVRGYCEEYRSRFDLFDPVAPFYQVAGLHTAKHEMSGLERLVLDVPGGEPFFTTRMGEGLRSMNAAEAARWLVTMQAYDASGIKSGAVGDPRVKGGKGYPIGVAWVGNLGGYLIEGQNLWQTLLLNFVSDQILNLGDSAVEWQDDVPVWERDPFTEKPEEEFDQSAAETGDTTFFHGPATLLTWQSRRILLAHEESTVTGVLMCNGDRLKPQNAQHYEMMSGWRRSETQEKSLKKPLVYMPRKHDPTRALWRGVPLLATRDNDTTDGVPSYLRPRTLDWLSQIFGDDGQHVPVRLHAFGVEYGNQEAVVDSSVDDFLDLNLTVLTTENPEMGQMLDKAVTVTDQGIGALRNLAANIARAEGLPVEAPRQKASELGYSTFDSLFRRWISELDGDDDLYAKYREWCELARRTLIRLGGRLVGQASPRAIVGRNVTVAAGSGDYRTDHYSVALAEVWYRGRLNKIFSGMEGPGTDRATSLGQD